MPLALVSRALPPMVLASRVCPLLPVATGGGVFGVATKTAVSASAMTDTAPTAPITRRPTSSPDTAPQPSTANAATSMMAATMPAVVRTSVKPNNPSFSESRYPPRTPSANSAPAAYASRRPVRGIAMARPKAAIICSRNSGPMVGIELYPVRYRSR